MMNIAWYYLEEVPYCFSRSSVKFQGHTAQLQFEFTKGYEMMHKAWSSIEEVPYCFWRPSIKFQGHPALKTVEFDPNWGFPGCNSSLNSPMAIKWCTRLEVASKKCSIVFQGHPSNFKVMAQKSESEYVYCHKSTTKHQIRADQLVRERDEISIFMHWDHISTLTNPCSHNNQMIT